EELPSSVQYASDAYLALQGADACLILTEWEEFASLDLDRVRTLLRYPIVVDGRNLFDPVKMEAADLNYYSVGRADVVRDGRIRQLKPAPVAINSATPARTNIEERAA